MLDPLTPAEQEVADGLRRHVEAIAAEPHNVRHPQALARAASYIESQFRNLGLGPSRQTFEVESTEVANIESESRGHRRPGRILVLGAHYDSVGDAPGANDNGSGVAVLLELARLHAARGPLDITVRFVAFVNEEPPYFMTQEMGSLVYAQRAAARHEHIVGMISLETLGYYSEESGSQQYPSPFQHLFPDRGNFVAMVSNFNSAPLLRTVASAFRSATSLPAIASPAPGGVPGVGWSDHWSFWQHGYPAVMLTDTAPYRYPYYHTMMDTPDKLDYERLARVVTGCAAAIHAIS